MLIQFRFSNYKSFRDDTILDLSATKVTEHPHHVTEIGNERILKTAAIFGANASGKTNIYHALRYMTFYVRRSFGFGGGDDSDNAAENPRPEPFLFDTASRDEDSIFEIFFTIPDDDKTYNYGFCVNKEKVTEEWLNSKARTARKSKSIFYRSRDGTLDLPGISEKFRDNLKVSLQDETLIVSLGAKLKVELLEKIYNWFGNVIFLNFGNPVENLFWSRRIPHKFAENPEVRKDVVDYLGSFDNGIVDFTLEEVKGETDKKSSEYRILAQHNVSGTDQRVAIPLSEEAAGTQKMFVLYSPLQRTLASGGVLFIDEFNDRLHPLLGRNFIQTFLDPERNPHNAQLLFTTHDTWQFSSELLRRDEIWIADKDRDGRSRLYSLVDFKGEDDSKIRKDENYEKNYLVGKYGGIPDLEGIYLEVR